MKTVLRLLIVSAGILLLGIPAMADSVSLTIPNAALASTPGPYGTVVYTLLGSAIHVSVTAAVPFEFFGKGNGNNGIFGFNVVGSMAGLQIQNIVSDPGGPITWDGAGGQMDGFGVFDVVLQDGNPTHGHSSFSFDVVRTGGFTAASDIF